MMNDQMEQFEDRLGRQPLREIPGEWRAEILAAAHGRRSPLAFRRSVFSTFHARLSTLLWPHPKAWAALAAVWIFIFALNFSLREVSPQLAEKSAPPSPAVIAELKNQQRLFAELSGLCEPSDAGRQRVFLPKPRSARADILMT